MSDTDRLMFLINTGYHVSSGCRAEFYFVSPWPGDFSTAREAIDNAIRCYDKHNGLNEWRRGWKSL